MKVGMEFYVAGEHLNSIYHATHMYCI